MTGVLNAFTGGTYTSAPGAPTIGTATAVTSTSATVAFTAPNFNGGSAITGYQAISSPGCITATNTASPITITGLTTNTSYTFKVRAQNAIGYGAYSGSSNSVTPQVTGSQSYTSSGSYSFVVPAGVTSISAVIIGAGGQGGFGGCYCGVPTGAGGGGGGGLTYTNNIPVTPGDTFTISVGSANSGSSVVKGASYWYANGGTYGQNAGCNTYGSPSLGGCGGSTVGSPHGCGGGNGGKGGNGGFGGYYQGGGAGGAGGYSGAGGAGGCGNVGAGGSNGSGGSGGGGGGGHSSAYCSGHVNWAGGGGGVGILGQGSNGCGGGKTGSGSTTTPLGGGGGSGGAAGGNGRASSPLPCGFGGAYGGGGGGTNGASGSNRAGACGAIRIVWPGSSRRFPSTCVGSP